MRTTADFSPTLEQSVRLRLAPRRATAAVVCLKLFGENRLESVRYPGLELLVNSRATPISTQIQTKPLNLGEKGEGRRKGETSWRRSLDNKKSAVVV